MVSRTLFLLLALAFLSTGCAKNTTTADGPAGPEERKKRAFQAGELAALGYLTIEKPTVDQAKAIRFVIDQVGKCCVDYQAGGFIAVKPAIDKGIDDLLKGEGKVAERLLAKKLSQILLEELDVQFNKRPEWKLQSEIVVEVLKAFADGANESFDDYIKGKAKTLKRTK